MKSFSNIILFLLKLSI